MVSIPVLAMALALGLGGSGATERTEPLSPIDVAEGLFDHGAKGTLGLATVRGEHALLYRATADGFKFCHHPNLVVFRGRLLAMWSNGRIDEDANGQRILSSFSVNGRSWSEPVVLVEDPDGPDGRMACVAAGFLAAGDTLVAYFTSIVGEHPIHADNALLAMTSRDGATWSRPTRIADGFFIDSPRPLQGGRILMNGQRANRQPRLMYTDRPDGLGGWKDGTVPVVNAFSYPEPGWFVRRDRAIVMLFRTKNDNRRLYASTSSDRGASWTRPVETAFPDATARFAAGNLPDGTAYIINNPSRDPGSVSFVGRRIPLTISLSDDGIRFDRALVIRGEDTRPRFTGRHKLEGWQYPAAVVWKDHLVVAYSINKEDIGVTRIALADLRRAAPAKTPTIRVVQGGESRARAAECRQMLVGPGVNQPEPFPGYHGFVGWESPLRLRNGDFLMGFSAGYWHASPPTPLRLLPETLATWEKLGMTTEINAPRGGRALLIRSTDDGRTWSKPGMLIDTPADDRHPGFVELPDGTILCTLFTWPGQGDLEREPELAARTAIIRSLDHGRTWESEPRRLPSPFAWDATDGPPIVLADGTVMLAVYGGPANKSVPSRIGVFRTVDSGVTWELLAVVKADHELSEASIAQLPDGRLVMVARPEGDVTWSRDGGRTWTPPASTGIRMFEPGLLVLRDGTLLCLHGSYGAGGLRAIFSTDGGQSWIAPDAKHGFAVDTSVYGYSKGIELPDGSVYLVYIHTGGHRREDAASEAIWAVRMRVRADHGGIELLPAPGR